MSEWEEEIERINHNLRQIRKELNDMSHCLARVEERVEATKQMISWMIGLLAFFGSLITVMTLM